MPKPGSTELMQNGSKLKRQMPPVRHRLGSKLQIQQEFVKGFRGFDRFDDDRISHYLLDAISAEMRDGARGGDRRLLQRLQSEKLALRRIPATEPPSRAPARIEVQQIRAPVEIEAPRMPLIGRADSLAEPMQVAQDILEAITGHDAVIWSADRFVFQCIKSARRIVR